MRRLFWILLFPLLGPACSGGIDLSGDGAGEEDGSTADGIDGVDAGDTPEELPDEAADVPVADCCWLDDGAVDETDVGELCAAQDARADGVCGLVLPGVVWDGAHCVPLGSGCSCVGADCGALYGDVDACVASRRECYGEVCRAQEAAGRMCDGGGCATVLGTFWDGRACFDVIGCECAGADCAAGYVSQDECRAVHASCDGALCLATGGSWFPASSGFCGFSCGLPSERDCFAPMDSCDCGPDRTFLPGTGCAVEGVSCEAGFLCRASGGVWHGLPECLCPIRCGEVLPECLVCGAACDCGPNRNFDGTLGCIPDLACPGSDRSTACTSTGGRWVECTGGDPWCSCGDFICGWPNVTEPCVMPGCDCGPLRGFDTERGCVYDATCVLRGPDAECGGGFGSYCRLGLSCCEGCGAAPGCPTCRAPCCPDDLSCMTDGCPEPPP